MKVALGNDQGGTILREAVINSIQSCGFEVVDCGIKTEDSVDYPDIAKEVCSKVTSGECKFGVLICGTGIGMSIAANKTPGIRCALLSDCYSATMTRSHNNANVMALGGRVIGPELASLIIATFLMTPFSNEERHQRRIDKLEIVQTEEIE